MNEFFQPGAVPAHSSPGSSAVIRQEFSSVAAGFDKLPILAGHAGEIVTVNSTGTALVTSGAVVGDYVTKDGAATVTNKTFPYSQNFWPGFGNSVTRDAGGFAGNVLLIQNDFQLPAMDAGLLYNLPNSALGIVDIAHGGTGASTLSGAQANLGIDLKANINSPALTGTPTAPTPGLGDSSARIATTFFVTNVLNTIGAVTPGDTLPLMDGNANAGTPGSFLVSRVDHVHPSDTSRAPASAATAAGTSFAPAGSIGAADVQAALQELDTEKAPLASPAFTGTPTAPTPPTQDTSTRLATTAWVQTELAAIPPAGMYPSNDIPLMAGVGSAGTAVEGARGDHRHPTDTSRAPLASPAFTGVPTAPTAAPGTSTLQLATTAFVQAVKAAIDAVLALRVSKTSDTGSAVIPVGTTAQRDAAPAKGYFRYNDDTDEFEGYKEGIGWGQVGGGQMYGAAAVKGIFYNAQTIAENVTIEAGTQGGSFGPITVADGFTVTVADGSVWSIV